MQVKIRQYKSMIQKQISEKKFFLKKKLNKLWDAFLEKGHEKMTIMLIPHNEKNIFNFHISKFTILFFISLFIIVVATSSFAIIKNASINSKKEELLTDYKDIRSNLLRYEKLTRDTARLVDKLKPYVEDIYRLTNDENDVDKIWEYADDTNSADAMKENKYFLPDEIFTLKGLQKELICTAKTVKTVKNFIDVRSKVIHDIPSIIPIPSPKLGRITSLYGWRRNPMFGGRDFHPGIDIGIAEGTEVRAPAPGIVMSAGWGQGYGWYIRLQHNYGYQTIFGHLSRFVVNQGSIVKKGQLIGYSGKSGTVTGPHLHYEIRLGNGTRDPASYLSIVW